MGGMPAMQRMQQDQQRQVGEAKALLARRKKEQDVRKAEEDRLTGIADQDKKRLASRKGAARGRASTILAGGEGALGSGSLATKDLLGI